MRPSKYLLKKQLRDIFKNIKQYIAVVLIALLAIALFSGLAANFRMLERRVDNLYNDANMSDIFLTTSFGEDKDGNFCGITSSDLEKIENISINNNKLNDIANIEKRLFLPINLFATENISTEKAIQSGINKDYNLILMDKDSKLNQITDLYDHKHNIIEYGLDKTTWDGIFIPRMQDSNIKIGDDIDVKFPISYAVKYLEDEMGIKIERDKNDNKLPTGRIVKENKTPLTLGELLDILGINSSLSKNPKIIEALSRPITGDLIEEFGTKYLSSDEITSKNNFFTKNSYLNFLKNLINPTGYISFKMELLGYVNHPESVDKNANTPTAFARRDIFFNYFKRAMETNYKREIHFTKMIFSLFEPSKYSKDSYNEMDKYFTPKFFDSGLYYKMSYYIKTNPDFSSGKLLKDESILKDIDKKIDVNNLYNQVIIKLNNKNSSDIKYIKSEIFNIYQAKERKESEPKLLLNQDINELYSNLTIEHELKQSRQLMYAFPVIFFLVAVLVIIATQLQLIFKERTQIGTLKALGLHDVEIYTHYILRTFIVTFLGALLGIIIGPLVIPFVLNGKYRLLYNLPSMTYVFPWFEVLILLLVFFLLVTFIVYLVCCKEVSHMPALSMRPKKIEIKFKVSKKEMKAKNIPAKMAFRNIRINFFRTFMTILGVLGCVALFIGGMGIDNTIKKGINHDIGLYYRCDITLAYSLGENAKEEIKKTEGIDPESVEEYFSQPVMLKNDKNNESTQTIAYGFLGNSQYFKPKECDMPEKGKVILSSKTAKNIGAKIGDRIYFRKLNGIEYSFLIKNITDAFFVQGVFFQLDDEENAPNLINETRMAYANILPNYKIDNVVKKLNEVPSISQIVTNETVKKIIGNVTTTIEIATATILVFAILLAFSVLYNLARLNLDLRHREIATLKVLGFTSFEITESLILEMLFLTIIGTLLGGLMGFPVLYLILSTNETPIISFMYHISWQSIIIGVLSAILLAYIINLLLARVANKTKMVESLKSVE